MKKVLLSLLTLIIVVTTIIYPPALAVSHNETSATTSSLSATWALYSIRIPDSTDMISTRGVVQNGVITYEATVKVQIKNNGTNYANQSITWSTTAGSSNATVISSKTETTTSSSGVAYGVFHIRNIQDVPIRVTCGGVTLSKTINIGTRASYISDFRTTQYITAIESDYSGSLISVGLDKKYKSDFIDAVELNGSGLGDDGNYIKYMDDGSYSYHAPVTSTGTTPKAGQTIAVDNYEIPRYKSGSTYKRGYITIQDGIGRRIAEDSGGAINNHRIDIYMGEGKSTLNSSDGYHSVLFMGVNSWGSNAANGGNTPELETANTGESSESKAYVCSAKCGTKTAYVSDIDYSKENSVTVSVVDSADESIAAVNSSARKDFSLSSHVLSVDDIQLNEDTLVTVGNVNPSLQLYQVFDINTGELLHQYCGYGFIEAGDDVLYVQAPRHFSENNGKVRILCSSGDMLYESGENRIVRGELKLDGNILTFEEMDSTTGEIFIKTIDITKPLAREKSMSYYSLEF